MTKKTKLKFVTLSLRDLSRVEAGFAPGYTGCYCTRDPGCPQRNTDNKTQVKALCRK